MASSRSRDPLGILLVDDSLPYSASVRQFLGSLPGVRVVGSCVNGPEAISKTLTLHPEVILLDIGLGGMSGFDVARALRVLRQPPAIIFLSMNSSAAYREEALRLGALGFIAKEDLVEELIPLLTPLLAQRNTA